MKTNKTLMLKYENKTLWQKIYSFFGFWTYQSIESEGETTTTKRILYWCFLPWFLWIRKFDLISWRVTNGPVTGL